MEPNQNMNVNSEQSVQTGAAPISAENNPVFQTKEKNNAGKIVGIVALIVMAVAGVAFGVYGMVTKDSEVAKMHALCAGADTSAQTDMTVDSTVAITSPLGVTYDLAETIDNNLASNLISPYIRPFRYLDNIFDRELNADTKFYVAYQNLAPNFIYNETFYYDSINAEYEYLFGEELQKTNYKEGYDEFSFSADAGGQFVRTNVGGGGTGLAMFTIVKDAHYGDSGLTVEVYHDVTPLCEANEGSDYCLKENNKHYTVVDDEIRSLIEEHEGDIPVYKMNFTPNDDHYVLTSVVKE